MKTNNKFNTIVRYDAQGDNIVGFNKRNEIIETLAEANLTKERMMLILHTIDMDKKNHHSVYGIVNHLKKETTARIFDEELIGLILDHDIELWCTNIDTSGISEEITSRIFMAYPNAIYNFNEDQLTERSVTEAVLSEPEIFDSMPQKFQTLRMALRIPADLRNYVNIDSTIFGQVLEEWKAKRHGFTINDKVYPFPLSPEQFLLDIEKHAAQSPTNMIRDIMQRMIPIVFRSFTPQQCWSACKTDFYREKAEEVFGRQVLLTQAQIDTSTKRQWLESEFNI